MVTTAWPSLGPPSSTHTPGTRTHTHSTHARTDYRKHAQTHRYDITNDESIMRYATNGLIMPSNIAMGTNEENGVLLA